MAQVAFSVRMDSELKEQFDTLCEEFGMNMTTAINVFARAVVREKRIPFDVSSTGASSTHLAETQAIYSAALNYATLEKNGEATLAAKALRALFDLADKENLSSNGKHWTREELNERD